MEDRTADFGSSAGADVAARAADLADHLPDGLSALAAVAYNYRWSWLPDEDVFREINPHRWELAAGNPVRFLSDLWPSTRANAERDGAEGERPPASLPRWGPSSPTPAPRSSVAGPVAYMCAEYGVHASLRSTRGGLGVLAGDTLKEASDRRLRRRDRAAVPARLPPPAAGHVRAAARVLGHERPEEPPDGAHLGGRGAAQALRGRLRPSDLLIWRVDVGASAPAHRLRGGRTTTCSAGTPPGCTRASARCGWPSTPSSGSAASRVLRALGIEPGVFHLNEGHPALAALESPRATSRRGPLPRKRSDACASGSSSTTHTPVPAGNETYGREELLAALPDLLPPRSRRGGVPRSLPDDAGRLGREPWDEPARDQVQAGLERGQRAARPGRPQDVAADVRGRRRGRGSDHARRRRARADTSPSRSRCSTTYLGEGWQRRVENPRTWEPVSSIPDEELWHASASPESG